MNEAIRSVLDSPEIPYGAYRRVAVDTLAPLGVEILPVIAKEITKLTPIANNQKGDWHKWKRAEKGIAALRHAAVRIALTARKPLSAEDRKTLETDLEDILEHELDVLQATLALVDEPTRTSLFEGEIRPKDYRSKLQLAFLVPATLPRVIEATAKMEIGKYDDQYLTRHATAIAGFGSSAVSTVIAAVPTATTDGATALVRGIQKTATAEHAAALVELLGHEVKDVRLSAAAALQHIGVDAKAALEQGAHSRKKAIREACAELVATLGAGRSRADELLAQAAPEREAIVARFTEALTKEHAEKEATQKELAAKGALAIAAAHDWLREKAGDYQARSIWTGTLSLLKDDPDAAWVAIKTFTSLPKISPYIYRELRSPLESMGKLIEAPLVAVLKGPAFPLRAPAFELLTEVSEKIDRDLLIAGLADPSKEIRARCTELLPAQHGKEVALLVMPLLGDKAGETRLAAAQVLAALGAPETHAALAAALEREKKADIAAALEKALAACGSTDKKSAKKGSEPARSAGDSEASILDLLAKERRAKLPTWVDFAKLPRLLLASGEPLNGEALTGFVTRLMNEGPDMEDPVARRVRPLLDDTAASAFSVAIKDAWAQNKGESKHKWAIYQQGILANDARLNAVAPRLDEMTSNGQHHLAAWYVDVLVRHGAASPHPTHTGLSWVAYWAKASETTSLRKKAAAALEAAAEARDQTVAQLESELNGYIADDVADTQLPTLGFEHAVTLDFGSRKFTLQVTPEFELVVKNEAGERLEKLPAAGKKDNAEKVKASKEEYTRLKKELTALAREQKARLENAMVSGRPWTKAAFEKLFLQHPLMRLLGERLVFVSGKATFRPQEGKLLNPSQAEVKLGTEPIRLVHRYELDDKIARIWGDNLADSKVIQPFDQIGRTVHPRSASVPISERKFPPATLGGRLHGSGWRHSSVEEAGMCYEAYRAFPGRKVRAQLSHGGIHVSDPGWTDDPVGIDSVWFTDLSGEPIEPEDVDPIVFSEVVRDVEHMLEE